MQFIETSLKDAYIIRLDKIEDERGFFARIFCKKEFKEKGLDNNIAQINNSFNKYRFTLRGLHYQISPKAETKMVRCIQGKIYDVIIDLRIDSPTFMKWSGIILSSENKDMLYVPKGFAHGFLTLEDNVEVIYFSTEYYSPDHERCVRWNDPVFSIEWPTKPLVISEKDKNAPDFNKYYHLGVND